jgi:hypothetical protein
MPCHIFNLWMPGMTRPLSGVFTKIPLNSTKSLSKKQFFENNEKNPVKWDAEPV